MILAFSCAWLKILFLYHIICVYVKKMFTTWMKGSWKLTICPSYCLWPLCMEVMSRGSSCWTPKIVPKFVSWFSCTNNKMAITHKSSFFGHGMTRYVLPVFCTVLSTDHFNQTTEAKIKNQESRVPLIIRIFLLTLYRPK